MRNKDLCMGCMHTKDREICETCGFQNVENDLKDLKTESVLDNRYIIGEKKEQNSESIDYIGFDSTLNCRVHIREFFPKEICTRDESSPKVTPVKNHTNTYYEDLNIFLGRYRSFARFRDSSAVVPIYNIFSENNTGYVISEYVDGETLMSFVQRMGGSISWDLAKQLFMPILSVLKKMHSAGVYHLGICPQNIIVSIRKPNEKEENLSNQLEIGTQIRTSACLTGFSMKEIRKSDSNFKPVLYDGYSALEQYTDIHPVDKSTDVYGFCASLFFAICGAPPLSAPERRRSDKLLISKSTIKNIPPNVISAIAGGLNVLPTNRTKDFSILRDELSDSADLFLETDIPNGSVPYEKTLKKKSKKKLIISSIAAFIIFCLISAGAFWFFTGSHNNNESAPQHAAYKEPDNIGKEKIPNLVGQNYEKVKVQYQPMGISILMSSDEFSSSIDEGCIISQIPKEDSLVDNVTTIVVVVSKGEKMRTLPSIVGDSISDASKKLTDLSLVPIQKKAPSNAVKEGFVIGYEMYKATDKVEYGSNVVILISTGTEKDN